MDLIEKESSHEEGPVYQFHPPAEEWKMIFNSGYTARWAKIGGQAVILNYFTTTYKGV